MLQEKHVLPNRIVHEYEGGFGVCYGIIISRHLIEISKSLAHKTFKFMKKVNN